MHDEESSDEDLTLNTKAVVRGFAKFVADLHENGEKKMGLTGDAIANSIVGQAHVTGADFLGENAPALFINLAKMVIGFTIARDAAPTFKPEDEGYGPATCNGREKRTGKGVQLDDDCGNELPPLRRAMGRHLCVECQTLLDRGRLR